MAKIIGSNGSDIIVGTDFNDLILGLAGADIITGDGGNDTIRGGAGADILDGDSGRDLLIGGTGNDTLAGGSGRDTLTGGLGADRFNFDSPNEGTDIITDFIAADDTIVVSPRNFGGGLKPGETIKPHQFRLGTAAGDPSDRFIYDRKSGALYFDRDGIGPSKQIQLATIANKPLLSHADIFVSEQFGFIVFEDSVSV
ncbi:Hemolysin-type calcium-binding region [Gloeocapsa sp. PCC 7428]|uniref:calcium-binding protein n=1 Tax=Gloeocapsa sp. PCC 7428 TaxID=1173026 RepID=UPI0002A5D126|nr:calcium-binding protein [Gloeocapsa sp. PCC 7428]AFZ32023.1 Hemolysin-type calcium-binding region [Gloeocapsa sp. PCC 7428]